MPGPSTPQQANLTKDQLRPKVARGWSSTSANIFSSRPLPQPQYVAKADVSHDWTLLTGTLSHNLPNALRQARDRAATMMQAVR